MIIDRAPSCRATLVLAHGAGAPMDSPFMEAIAQGLVAHDVTVVRFEFPYMDARRRTHRRAPPNRMPVLEQTFEQVVRSILSPRAPASVATAQGLFIGGKSMGGRVATHIADRLGARGVIALGYPFHPPERPDKLRTEHLQTLRTRCLIVQGTRDPLGTAAEVATYPLSKKVRVAWIEDGDHSLVPRRQSGRTVEQNLAEAVTRVARFIHASRGRAVPA
jgi:hypothetical protein